MGTPACHVWTTSWCHKYECSPKNSILYFGITENSLYNAFSLCVKHCIYRVVQYWFSGFKVICNLQNHLLVLVELCILKLVINKIPRFLPALMEFWLGKLKTLCEPEKKWLTEWIFEFLQSTNSYSSLIYALKPDFFHQFVQLITHGSTLLTVGAKILEWFCKDQGYMQLVIQSLFITKIEFWSNNFFK